MRIARLCVRFAMLLPASAYLITSPPDGTVVSPGHMIGIQVSASGPPLKGVGILRPDGLGSRVVEGGGPYYQFDVAQYL